MKVLIIGSGGREHALAWKVAQSEAVRNVFVAPGNAGTEAEPKVANVDIGADDTNGLLRFARDNDIGLTIVGPEAPLVAGVSDRFNSAGLKIFGPTRAAAQLEGSKAFTKAFLERHRIPTAAYESFTELGAALDYVSNAGAPLVIKADGLAAGKGVVIAESEGEAAAALKAMLVESRFGDAGQRVVVEEFLQGEEASFIAIVGGGKILSLASSQDHKAVYDGDRGPNTGGMGAYSPAPVVDAGMHARIMREVIEPTVSGLQSEGLDYTGFLYAGLMIGEDGAPRVLEYNCRCGDPETQPIMMRLQSDLVRLCEAAVDGDLGSLKADWSDEVCVGVVMASAGYPGEYASGDPIDGLGDALRGTKVFHAGTAMKEGRVVTAGGRVLCVCGLGKSVTDAQALAYRRVGQIRWSGVYYRTDIGYRAIAREKSRR
ncbi:MAG TPA: phosphoribosylamine--glycine ligase [Gammaproteobacteria bacterium]|nr:phosphoribosylamine--glycine ligase [Gammaproteobacteria bacterium]